MYPKVTGVQKVNNISGKRFMANRKQAFVNKAMGRNDAISL